MSDNTTRLRRSILRTHCLLPLLGLLLPALSGSVGAQTNLYWGDLHIHTNYSLDAFGVRNTKITPDMAYRFARGIPIHHDVLDTKVQIDRPLDFLAVTDTATTSASTCRW